MASEDEQGTNSFPKTFDISAGQDRGYTWVNDENRVNAASGEAGNPGQQPENPWMKYKLVQALSGFGKGVVRAVGFQVHPSLGEDLPFEHAVSDVTQRMQPGLNVPKAFGMATLAASGQELTPDQKLKLLEGGVGTVAKFVMPLAPEGYQHAYEGIDAFKKIDDQVNDWKTKTDGGQ